MRRRSSKSSAASRPHDNPTHPTSHVSHFHRPTHHVRSHSADSHVHLLSDDGSNGHDSRGSGAMLSDALGSGKFD